MASGTQSNRPTEAPRPTTDEIDDKYADVDPDDVAEDAIDYFDDDPRTESEKLDREQVGRGNVHEESG